MELKNQIKNSLAKANNVFSESQAETGINIRMPLFRDGCSARLMNSTTKKGQG